MEDQTKKGDRTISVLNDGTEISPAQAKMINAQIFAAMEAIREEVGTLVRNERNGFANFNYASIDQFYQQVVPIAAKHGIQWTANNSNPRPYEGGEDDKTSILTDVSIDLRFRDGTVIKGYMEFIVIHQLMGAQTSLSVLSYADKAFMRSAFKIPTQESDQDGFDNSRYQRSRGKYLAPKGKHVQKAPESNATKSNDDQNFESDVERIARLRAEAVTRQQEEFEKFEAKIKQRVLETVSVPYLETVWTAEKAMLGHIKTTDEARYGRIFAAFAEHKRILISRQQYVAGKPNGTPPSMNVTAPPPPWYS